MKVVSDNFKARAENPFGARFITRIVVDGNTLTDDIEDFKYSTMCNPDGDFSFGNTCAASVTFSITQPSKNLSGKEIEVYQGLEVDGELEEILLGKFKVLKVTEDKGKFSYECYDRMISRMEMAYFSDLSGTVTDVQILHEICEQTGITLTNAKELTAHNLASIPVGYTRREVIAYMAQLQGKNALINAEGNLELIWYTDTDFVVDDEKIYLDGTDTINDETDYTLEYLKCSVTNSESSEKVELTSGSGNVGITFENPFMTQEILDEVFSRIGGFSFRPVEVEFLGDFRLEAGDIVTVTTNGASYVVPIMQLEHRSDGGVITVIQSVAETDEEKQIDTKGPVTKKMERYYAELVLLNNALVNKLSADEADIRYLKTDEVDALTARVEDAVIENLNADFAKVEDLQATNAKVAELETNALTADSATIQNLETGVAEINTLMFGAVGGTSIQSEFANAVIAQLGEAQIKSAMIESVSAEQITAGDIITNNVRIKSEDGSLILSDETLQISDENHVRVQIGKDANNDYSINIWDASGDLMFSQGGITENAIKNAIIRDDMISENANISAKKLDIDSLFTEINDSSNTIKATQIYFDDEEQTLSAAFKSMTTTVDELSSKQTTQGTEIEAIQGQISSKIWQQDITTAVDNVERDVLALNSQYSTLNHTVNGLSSTVGSHTTEISGLDTRVESSETNYEQLSSKFNWIVKSGTTASDFTITDRMASLTAEYINLNGVVTFSGLESTVTNAINNSVSNATNALNRATYHYGTCGTAAATAAKVVTLSNFSLYTGAMVSVYFTYANTAANPTLNVNGTGAKSIRVNNAAITSKYYWQAKNTVTFVYNGTYWVMADSSANTLIAGWRSDSDVTKINGGLIETKSIKADSIDVEELFSKDIMATGTITGANLIGAIINGGKINLQGDDALDDPCIVIRDTNNDYIANFSSEMIHLYNFDYSYYGVALERCLRVNASEIKMGTLNYPAFNQKGGVRLFHKDDLSSVNSGLALYAEGSEFAGIMAYTFSSKINQEPILKITNSSGNIYASYSAEGINASGKYIISTECGLDVTGGVLTADAVKTTAGADLDTLNTTVGNIKLTTVTFSGISIAANAYVSPYTYYGSVSLASYVSKYGIPIRVSALGASGIPTPCHLRTDNVAVIVSNTASPTLVVTFMGGVSQTLV